MVATASKAVQDTLATSVALQLMKRLNEALLRPVAKRFAR